MKNDKKYKHWSTKTLHKKRTYCFYRGIEGNKLSVFEIKRSSWYWKCHLAQGALWCSIFSFLYTAVLSFRPFSFDHCIVCLSSIYGLWLHFWYRQPFIMVWIFNTRWDYSYNLYFCGCIWIHVNCGSTTIYWQMLLHKVI
jgi:hypothetical protein